MLAAYTGPQVAWGMARGGPGAFGGTKINSYSVWLGFCAAFLIGLADWRRLFSLRNLDLVMMLSFSVSLWYFNRGDIFTAMPLAYPGMAWLLAALHLDRAQRPGAARLDRLAGLGADRGDRVPRGLPHRPQRARLERDRRRALGRDRRAADRDLRRPVRATSRSRATRPACGPADANGEIRNRIQTNGRCEAADAQGDTYGPVSYEAYLPGYLMFGWSGKWDTLPAAHATSVLWDVLCIIGLWLVGWRFGGARLAATLGVRLGRVAVLRSTRRARTRTT